jgi:large subunit ribosomal protein L30
VAAKSTVRITQRKSSNGSTRNQRETLRSLGLNRIGKSVERPDGPQVRGMITTVRHLVETDEVSGAAEESKSG